MADLARDVERVGADEVGRLAALHRRPLLLALKVVEEGGERVLVGRLRLLDRRVDESAPLAVLAVAGVPERVAHLRLVLGVPRLLPQLVAAVRELALVPVLAEAPLLYLVAQLRLVLVVGRRLYFRQPVFVHGRQRVDLRHQLGHLKVVALEASSRRLGVLERLVGQSAYGRHGVSTEVAPALRPRAHRRHRAEEQVVGAGRGRLVDEPVQTEALERVRVALWGFPQVGTDGVEARVGAGGGAGGDFHAEDALLERV